MISIINPLSKLAGPNFYPGSLSKTGIIASVFLIVLLIIKELTDAIIDDSVSSRRSFLRVFSQSVNIGLFPMLYVFITIVAFKFYQVILR